LTYSRIFFAFLAIVFFSPSIFLTSPSPVHASNIDITPSSGTVGTNIQIDGDGFAGSLATVYWDDRMILNKIPISEAGQLSFDFQAPTDIKGNHVVKITDDSNWANSTVSATFTIKPGISIFPSVGRPYSSITVIGNGFTSLEKDINVTWDHSVLPVSATANHLGVWSVNIDAPGPDKGEYYIGAFSSSTDKSEIGEHKFIAGPFAKIQPTSGPVGSEISMEGYGFRTSEDGITITWDNKILECNFIAGMDGVLDITFTIPSATEGHHVVGLFGSDFTPKGIIPDMDFNIVPTIELKPSSGNKGTKVNVIGTGFNANETVTFSYGGTSLNIGATADSNGNFTTNFMPPQSDVKENNVTVTGTDGNSAKAIFIIDRVTPPAPIVISPIQGAKLEAFNSVGDVFLGVIKQLFKIISFRNAEQRGLGLSATTFDWSDSNTQGKTTYTFEIANGNDFSSPAIIKKELLDSEYTLSKNDILTTGTHSWRVRAVDDADNEGLWSNTQEFEVIPMSNQVLIMSLVIPLVFIGVVAGLGTIIWRRYKIKR
jgi:hypothetical protein